MTANRTLLQKKYARIIEKYAEICGVDEKTALRRFYKSDLYYCVSHGISDLHCMSDDYLVAELKDEWAQRVG